MLLVDSLSELSTIVELLESPFNYIGTSLH